MTAYVIDMDGDKWWAGEYVHTKNPNRRIYRFMCKNGEWTYYSDNVWFNSRRDIIRKVKAKAGKNVELLSYHAYNLKYREGVYFK